MQRFSKLMTKVINFKNILYVNFSYNRCFSSFFYVHVTSVNLPKQLLYEKFVPITFFEMTKGPRNAKISWRAALCSQCLANLSYDRKVVGSNLTSSKILDGNGVKAMPGSIPAPNSGALQKNKNYTVNPMGQTQKFFLDKQQNVLVRFPH